MKRSELIARVLVGALVVAAAGVPLWFKSQTPLIHARMADTGGWTPDVLQAMVGEPLHLRLTSDDVMHGFAVGEMDMQSVDVEPGKVTDLSLTFRKPGSYTFYCTRWCGINHWRMRGTINVSGEETASASGNPPLYVQLGTDLDAPREAPSVPSAQPSAAMPTDINDAFVSRFTNVDAYRSHSPYEVWKELRADAALSKLDDQQLWNMVAFIWQANASSDDIAEGKKLFEQNCAACHGEGGGGNGVFADQLAQAGAAPGPNMMIQRPADLSNTKRMLAASPALLQGKILRGGMGTGMPSWGPIFTEDETWKIVSYLYTFQFKEFNP